MSQEISLAEYEYYRLERLPIEDLNRGNIVMLYAKLQAGDPNVTNATKDSRFQSDHLVFARTLCRINLIMARTVLPNQIDIGFDNKKCNQNEVRVPVSDDNTFSVREHVSLVSMHKAFFDLIADHNLTQIDYALPDIRLGKGFYMPDGFLVDIESHGSQQLQSMMVGGFEDGDGSAGAMLPAKPKTPIPTESVEIEITRRN